VTNEVQQPACPFAFGAHTRVGQPDRRHEIAAGELGQHPGVDSIGLAGKRCEPFHLLRVGDLDLPAVKLESVVHETSAVHRLDRGPNRLTMTSEPLAQAAQTVSVGRRCADVDGRTLLVEQVEVETLATEIQPGVQHCVGPPFVSRGGAEHDSAGGPSSWHSLPARA
jgi:hypothetical protein